MYSVLCIYCIYDVPMRKCIYLLYILVFTYEGVFTVYSVNSLVSATWIRASMMRAIAHSLPIMTSFCFLDSSLKKPE